MNMLCSNPQCSYTHWVLHANYPPVKQKNRNVSSSSSRDQKFYEKKRVIISKLLNEYKPSNTSKKKQSHDQQFMFQTHKHKYSSQESILIPKDPTSPYAFTLNVNNIHKRKKKYFINQVHRLNSSKQRWYSN